MEFIFEVIDKTGRKIHLTKERWKHIMKKHPEIQDLELMKETVRNPDKIVSYDLNATVKYYYKYFKYRRSNSYLLVVVKYLNGKGYIITSYFERSIR